MNLKQHYDTLFSNALKAFEMDRYDIDPLIESENDRRFGLTLLLRPAENVRNEIQQLLRDLRAVEPEQYFYPESDLHVTVMSIVSCYDGFTLDQISVEEYITVITRSLMDIKRFDIEFQGLTASPSCVMLAGFPKTEALNEIRENLRKAFKGSHLQQSIDARYSIQTAHSTVFRLKQRLENKIGLLDLLQKYQHRCFGVSTVDTIEFVYNDWYQRNENVKLLHRFSLQ